MIPVGMQMYSMRQIANEDYDKALAAVKDIGYPGAQVSGMGNVESAADMVALFKKHDLVAAAMHVGLDAIEGDLDTVIADLKTLGITDIAVPSIPGDRREDAAAWEQVAKSMDCQGAKLKAEGIQLTYHNHAFEFETIEGAGKSGYDILFENSDLANLQPEIDTYGVAYGGEDPVKMLERFSGHINLVHIKDGKLGEGKPHFTEIGEGDLDWAPILAACEAGGAKWLLVEQDTTEIGPVESARLSFENLKKMGAA